MQTSGDPERGGGDSEQPPFHFPESSGTARVPDKEVGEPDTVLCQLEPEEAEALCERLRRRGIACEMRPAELVRDEIAIIVAKAELDTARHWRDLPDEDSDDEEHDEARDAEDGEEEPEQDRIAEMVDNFVCPECRTRTLDVMPRRGPSRVARSVAIGMVIGPILVSIITSTLRMRTIDRLLDDLPSWWPMAYVLAIGALVVYVVSNKCTRRCSVCGWQSTPTGFPVKVKPGISGANGDDDKDNDAQRTADDLDELPPAAGGGGALRQRGRGTPADPRDEADHIDPGRDRT